MELIFSHLIAALGGAVIMAQLLAMGRRPLPPRQPLEEMAPKSWPLPKDGPNRELALLERALSAASDAYYYLLLTEEKTRGLRQNGDILSISSGLVNLIEIRRNSLKQKLHSTSKS